MKCLIDGECWQAVTGYEGLYDVSNLGRVKSLEKVRVQRGRHPTPYENLYKERLLTPSGAPYLMVGLHKDGGVERVLVHRLVAQHFCPNLDFKLEVNHIDECKTNNLASNLEWCTRRENALHSVKKFRGSNSGTAKLDEASVLKIVELLKNAWTQIDIAEQFGVTNHTIHKIKCGKNWGWLTGLDKEGA